MTAEIIRFADIATLRQSVEAAVNDVAKLDDPEVFPDISAPKDEPTEQDMAALKESLKEYEARIYDCSTVEEFLPLLKLALIPEDYEGILCGIMDEEYYHVLDDDGKKFVQCYFNLLNPGPRGSAA
jgi:hypothetical protein